MRTTIKTIFFLLIGAAFYVGCSDQPEPGPEPVGSSDAIRFTGSSSVYTEVRAAAGFPNDGRIGVIAAYDTTGDWRTYTDILDSPANADTLTSGTYYFRWDTLKYWPLNNASLRFMAYSPISYENSAVQLAYDRTRLILTLQEDMPDVLYASNNDSTLIRGYRKTDNAVVDLGEFRHALSQLTVRITADTEMNPAVTLRGMDVLTNKKDATLYLPGGDNGLQLGPDSDFTYALISSDTKLTPTDTLSYTVLLYPQSQDYTYVNLTLEDGEFTVNRSLPMSEFVNTDNTGNFLTLERAKNTILTITVTGTTVQNPDEYTILQGVLSDWYEAGDFIVTIK